MCLIALALNHHERYPLVFAANRDEFYDRPTAPLHIWEDHPEVAAGRDLKAGGTWMGITPTGRLAAVTNVREPGRYIETARSRGELPVDFLTGQRTGAEYAEMLRERAAEYNGFNLLAGTGAALWHVSNRYGASKATRLGAGIHTLSNAYLNTPWPKSKRSRRMLGDILAQDTIHFGSLFALLQDRTPAPPDELPNTGIERELEEAVSSIFISTPDYGTRCSTAVLLERSGRIQIAERTFDSSAEVVTETQFSFESLGS